MLFQSIQLDDGNIVTVAGMVAFETYEFNQQPKRCTPSKNKLAIESMENVVRSMLKHYTAYSIIDDRFLKKSNVSLPVITCAVILRSHLSQEQLRSLAVIYYQDDLKPLMNDSNLKRIKAIDWMSLSQVYYL